MIQRDPGSRRRAVLQALVHRSGSAHNSFNGASLQSSLTGAAGSDVAVVTVSSSSGLLNDDSSASASTCAEMRQWVLPAALRGVDDPRPVAPDEGGDALGGQTTMTPTSFAAWHLTFFHWLLALLFVTMTGWYYSSGAALLRVLKQGASRPLPGTHPIEASGAPSVGASCRSTTRQQALGGGCARQGLGNDLAPRSNGTVLECIPTALATTCSAPSSCKQSQNTKNDACRLLPTVRTACTRSD